MKAGFIQMRVSQTERQVILKGASKAGESITDFIKHSVLMRIKSLAKTEPVRDEFADALESLSAAEKIEAPEEIRKLFPKVRAAAASGILKGISTREARNMVRKALKAR